MSMSTMLQKIERGSGVQTAHLIFLLCVAMLLAHFIKTKYLY